MRKEATTNLTKTQLFQAKLPTTLPDRTQENEWKLVKSGIDVWTCPQRNAGCDVCFVYLSNRNSCIDKGNTTLPRLNTILK